MSLLIGDSGCYSVSSDWIPLTILLEVLMESVKIAVKFIMTSSVDPRNIMGSL